VEGRERHVEQRPTRARLVGAAGGVGGTGDHAGEPAIVVIGMGAPPDAIDGRAVVALCQVLDAACYDRFIGELSATADAGQAAAVVRRWVARAGAAARRGRRGRSEARDVPRPRTDR